MNEFVSVIIPCRNEVRFLGACLDSILQGTYPRERMEVLVIDGGSEDGTRALVADYGHRDQRVRLLDNPEKTTPYALNRGIAAARGEIIARVDAHALVAPDYLDLCVQHLRKGEAANVGGAMRTLAADPGLFAPAIIRALSHRFGVGNSAFRTTAGPDNRTDSNGTSSQPQWVDTVFGGCWRREVFRQLGGFNVALRRSQDMEFSRRLQQAGGRTLLDPAIRCDYFARTGFVNFCRHNFVNGQWSILPFLYSALIPVSWRHLIPLVFVSALAVSMLALFWTSWPLGLVAGSYALANLAASAHSAWGHTGRHSARHSSQDLRFTLLVLLPVVFAALHLGYGMGSLYGVAQTVTILARRAYVGREGSGHETPHSQSGQAPSAATRLTRSQRAASSE